MAKARWAPSRGAGGQEAAQASGRAVAAAAVRISRRREAGHQEGFPRGVTEDGFRCSGNLPEAGGDLQAKSRTASAPYRPARG